MRTKTRENPLNRAQTALNNLANNSRTCAPRTAPEGAASPTRSIELKGVRQYLVVAACARPSGQDGIRSLVN